MAFHWQMASHGFRSCIRQPPCTICIDEVDSIHINNRHFIKTVVWWFGSMFKQEALFQVFYPIFDSQMWWYFDVVANRLPLLINPAKFACEIDYLRFIWFCLPQFGLEMSNSFIILSNEFFLVDENHMHFGIFNGWDRTSRLFACLRWKCVLFRRNGIQWHAKGQSCIKSDSHNYFSLFHFVCYLNRFQLITLLSN